MLFLQAMNSERGIELYNTVVYGLEGVHWEFVDKENGEIRTFEYDTSQGTSSESYCNHKWLMGNSFNAYINQGGSKEWNEACMKANENAVASKLVGISFDFTSVQSKIDQINAIYGEYKDALIYGSKGKDWEVYYDEFAEKIKIAGVDEVIEELQKQVDAFLADQ